MCILYVLFHFYFTIIRIIFPIIFPIISQRTIISLYYFTIISLLYLLFLLLFLIISGFRIPIFRSWRTPILVWCAERWLMSVQDRQLRFGKTRHACFMKPSPHTQLKEDYYTHYFLYYSYYSDSFQDLAACNRDLRTAGRHTTIICYVIIWCIMPLHQEESSCSSHMGSIYALLLCIIRIISLLFAIILIIS